MDYRGGDQGSVYMVVWLQVIVRRRGLGLRHVCCCCVGDTLRRCSNFWRYISVGADDRASVDTN